MSEIPQYVRDAYVRTQHQLATSQREFYASSKYEYAEVARAIRDAGQLPVFVYRRRVRWGAVLKYTLLARHPDEFNGEFADIALVPRDGHITVTFMRIRYSTRTSDSQTFDGGDRVVTHTIHTKRIVNRKRRRFRVTRGMSTVTAKEVIASLALDILRSKHPETHGKDEEGTWNEQWYYEGNIQITED